MTKTIKCLNDAKNHATKAADHLSYASQLLNIRAPYVAPNAAIYDRALNDIINYSVKDLEAHLDDTMKNARKERTDAQYFAYQIRRNILMLTSLLTDFEGAQ